MKQMRIKHNETGRSMVEMLGVLAVVGVLSIGGVAGYRYAVDKMNANEIINELKKRAITASQQRVLGQDINLAEYGVGAKIKGTYTVTPTRNYDGNASQFALEVAGVPERVCDMILESDWALPTEKVVANGSCVEGGNTMTFAFNNTLGSGDAGNGGNNNGNEGNDTTSDNPTQKCGENEYQLPDGTCKEDTSGCGNNQFWNSSWGARDCDDCPTEERKWIKNDSDMEDSCLKCPNVQQGNSTDSSFYCVWCPSDRVVCENTCCQTGQQCKYTSSGYECTPLGAGECITNEDCNNETGKEDYYCKNAEGCTKMIGTCEKVETKTVSFGSGVIYTASTNRMSWYAAKNFCAVLGMELVPADTHCNADEWASAQKYSYGGKCAGWKTGEYEDWWTANAAGSCASYRVEGFSGYLSKVILNYNGYGNALCMGK